VFNRFQPNESGFVLLGDLTLDSSSTDLDDAYHMVSFNEEQKGRKLFG
jgi:hypothetical protein